MQKITSRPTAYLIDASIYIFRAWFSIPDSMKGADGSPVNAIYGFCRFLTEFVEKSEATHVGIAFDESLTSSFRNDIYPQYRDEPRIYLPRNYHDNLNCAEELLRHQDSIVLAAPSMRRMI